MLRTSNRVRVGKVAFPGNERPEAALIALQDIPADTYIWELHGILSLDVVSTRAVSVITPHSSQRLTHGDRIMAGSARLANHHCNPNGLVSQVYSRQSILIVLQLEPIPDHHIFVIKTLRDILADEEITVGYGKGYFNGISCLCSACTGEKPVYTQSVDISRFTMR